MTIPCKQQPKAIVHLELTINKPTQLAEE